MTNAPLLVSQRFANGLTRKFKDVKYIGAGWDAIAGRRYDKIVTLDDQGQPRSAHAFVDRQTGLLYKAEGWAKPAKGARYDISTAEKVDQVVALADWTGGYLYAR